jgi:lipoate-protein ligase A
MVTKDKSFGQIKGIRVLNYGLSDYLDSQYIYHAVAHAFNKNTPETLVIISPAETYACIGFFQDMKKEIDLEFCRRNNIPVLRREVGGGAVLLDKNQVFFQFIFSRKNTKGDVAAIYRDFLEPAVRTYNRFGLKVFHRPINDLQINGRKIGGTGAASIGQSIVVVGSFMFDFNYNLMTEILKVPSEKFRDKLYKNIKDYITTIKKEFSNINEKPPSPDDIINIFFEEVKKKFCTEIFFEKSLSPIENEKLDEIRKKFAEKKWLFRRGKSIENRVKISSYVNIMEGDYKASGGLIRITLIREENIIKDIDITGDFTLMPADSLSTIEKELCGVEIDYVIMKKRLQDLYSRFNIQSPGIRPEDFITAIKTII